mgnify:CR=1 FL=1
MSPDASVRLERHQLAEAGDVLARAFHADPIWTWVFPDSAERARTLPWFMEVGTRYCFLFGETYTTSGRVAGAADWLTPGNTNFPPKRLIEAGYAPMKEKFGPESYGRFMGMLAMEQPLHDEAVPGPHYYLMTLGVDPPCQGQGVGGALIQPVLARADGEGLPCYLETEREINVTFYRRHGFEVVTEFDAPGGGPHIWTMMREPGGKRP